MKNYFRGEIQSIKNLPENLKGELTVVLSSKTSEKDYKKEYKRIS